MSWWPHVELEVELEFQAYTGESYMSLVEAYVIDRGMDDDEIARLRAELFSDEAKNARTVARVKRSRPRKAKRVA